MASKSYAAAVEDFRRARQEAGLQQILNRWTGKSLDLLSFEDVRRTLKAHTMIERGLHEIPLDAIVGSVGRYRDFTRTFLPKDDSDEGRWAAVKVAYENQGLPPITVYQIGDVYFVQDGNHRVSVARQLGNKVIEAYVTEVETRVPLTPDMQPDELILKAEYVEFLEQTHLDELRPAVDFSLTAPGKYPLLLEHIEVHRYYMGIEWQRDVPYEEAVTHWCDQVYLPTVHLIREAGLLREFPERTEADLYIWLAEHRAEVERALGWRVPAGAAAADLAEQFGSYEPVSVLDRVLSAMLPGSAPPGNGVGRWRRERMASPDGMQVMQTILVPVLGDEPDWAALEQAVRVARRENSHIFGLAAVPQAAQRDSIRIQALRAEFERRCSACQAHGELMVEVGDLEELVLQRARWIDVMVLRPFTAPNEKEATLFQRLIQRTSCPVLVVTGQATELARPLLAYDGGAAADEALYAAAYLGSRWQAPLVVLTLAADDDSQAEAAAHVRAYLDANDVPATFESRADGAPTAILETAAAHARDLIVIGSPRLNTLFQPSLSATVRQLLQTTPVPMLICR
ncbi:MAG: universal stress protein [Anaerolineales bacterium]|nr:universal stress protein [Anaerolineales bacterium]